MLHIQFTKDAQKFLSKITQKKHLLQIKHKLEQLKIDPFPKDSKLLHGNLHGMYRADIGEYRIVYGVQTAEAVLQIFNIGKRNDGRVYKKISRK